jgi:hypothetical protein
MFAKKLVKILCYRFERKTTKVALVRLLAKKFRRRNVSARERNASARGRIIITGHQLESALGRNLAKGRLGIHFDAKK